MSAARQARLFLRPRPVAVAGVMALTVLSSACGEPSDRRLNIRVRGTNDGATLDRQTGSEIDGDLVLYGALMRIAAVTVRGGADPVHFAVPRNIDLFETRTLLDRSIPVGEVGELELALPQPATDGVLPGEAVTVFVAGLLAGDVVEYRDAAMDGIVLAIPANDSAGELNLLLEVNLHDWFDPVDHEELALAQQPPYHIDAAAMPELAEKIEATIRTSISLRLTSDKVGEDQTCEGCPDDSVEE